MLASLERAPLLNRILITALAMLLGFGAVVAVVSLVAVSAAKAAFPPADETALAATSAAGEVDSDASAEAPPKAAVTARPSGKAARKPSGGRPTSAKTSAKRAKGDASE